MKECAICGETFYGHVDDEICYSCELGVQAYHENMQQEALAYAEWAESECQACGLPNPVCDCEVVVSRD